MRKFIFIALPLIAFSFHTANANEAPSPETNKNLELLTQDGDIEGYDNYKVFLDKSSVKKVKNKVLFNMVVQGLDVDRDKTYETNNTTSNEDTFDISNNTMVVINDIDCSTKKITPLKYLTRDMRTGERTEVKAQESDYSAPKTEEDIKFVDKIHQLVCK
ncbi:hypothetical protein [Acinetobacter sp. P1(2025)]|uniref:hypothetical protein n=1 Tax=Acinetobacter sp. P1(2025) TaxID=3446120 RepID=UPI003F531CCD